jgi:hypothetical protein
LKRNRYLLGGKRREEKRRGEERKRKKSNPTKASLPQAKTWKGNPQKEKQQYKPTTTDKRHVLSPTIKKTFTKT